MVTRKNRARQTSGVSEGVADRDLVLDTEREAVTVKIKPSVGDRDSDAVRDCDALAKADEVALGDADGGSVGQTTRMT